MLVPEAISHPTHAIATQDMADNRARIHISFEPDLIAAIDATVGRQGRSVFINDVLRRAMSQRGWKIRKPPTQRGRYDREKFGLVSPKTAAKKQRRNRRRAWGRKHTKAWRERVAAKKASEVEAATNPQVEVWPDGSLTVLSPLGGGSQSLGYISQSGELMLETSRFPRAGVVAAIVRVLDEDTVGRLRGDRFERFRATAVDG